MERVTTARVKALRQEILSHKVYITEDDRLAFTTTADGVVETATLVIARMGEDLDYVGKLLLESPDLPDDWDVSNPDAFHAFTEAYRAWVKTRDAAAQKATGVDK